LHEEEKHIDIREKLRRLPKVKANENFLNSLQSKINLLESEKSSKSLHKKHVENIEKGFFGKIFGTQKNPWLIPALGFTVVLFFIFTVVYINVKQNKFSITEEQTKDDKSLITEDKRTEESQNKESTDVQKEEEPGREIAEDFSVREGYDEKSPTMTKRGFNERDGYREDLPKGVDDDGIEDGLKIEKQDIYFAEPEKDTDETTGKEMEKKDVIETQKIEKGVRKVSPLIKEENEEVDKVTDKKDMKKKSNKSEKDIEDAMKGLNKIDKSDLERIQEEILNK
jgi:hypothetical protein